MPRLLPRCAFTLLALTSFATALSAAEASKSKPRTFAVAALGNPRSIAVDAAGNLYVGDFDSGAINRITPRGEMLAIPGSQSIRTPLGLAADGQGGVIVGDTDQNRVCRIAADGTLAELGRPGKNEAGFSTPTGVVVDADGNVFVTDNGAAIIRKIARDGTLTTFAGARSESGSADGTGSTARFMTPRGIAIDRAGNLYVADEGNHNIRKISPTGAVTTLAGAAGMSGAVDGRGNAARFGAPRGLAVDAAGNVYVADTDNHTVRKISPAGVVSTLAGQPGEAGNADGKGSAARFSELRGIAVDAAGNIFVADTGNVSVRQITPDGIVTTIAAAQPR